MPYRAALIDNVFLVRWSGLPTLKDVEGLVREVERARGDELAQRLDKIERQHEELKKVAIEVEGRLERAMEYIRSLLAADQQ